MDETYEGRLSYRSLVEFLEDIRNENFLLYFRTRIGIYQAFPNIHRYLANNQKNELQARSMREKGKR